MGKTVKYYTPELEEFHVGFDFEVLNKNWEKVTLNASRLQEINFDDNTTGLSKYRVKCLDEEDIKELGWEFDSTNGMVSWFKGSESWFGKTIPSSPLYKYWEYLMKFDPLYSSVQIHCKTSNNDTEVFFEGIIKNKSQLKKLMQQIGIKDEV